MSALAGLEAERSAYQEQLDLVHGQIRDDPDNAELAALADELKSLVDMIEGNIADLKPKSAPTTAPKQPTPPPAEPPKWSRENHPAYKNATSPPPPPEEKEEAVIYHVNDTVQAKWLSGDKGFYPAKITSITGSASAPIYVVKFKSYDNTETLRARDIRPMNNKRKADSQSAGAASYSTPAPPAPVGPGVVSSASAQKYPDAQKDAEKLGEEPKKPKAKKIKANKELEKGKSKWQDFQAKGKFGKAKKDSMFRTPEGAGGRVGFIGSGQTMRKDPTRSRHVYEMNDELD